MSWDSLEMRAGRFRPKAAASLGCAEPTGRPPGIPGLVRTMLLRRSVLPAFALAPADAARDAAVRRAAPSCGTPRGSAGLRPHPARKKLQVWGTLDAHHAEVRAFLLVLDFRIAWGDGSSPCGPVMA